MADTTRAKEPNRRGRERKKERKEIKLVGDGGDPPGRGVAWRAYVGDDRRRKREARQGNPARIGARAPRIPRPDRPGPRAPLVGVLLDPRASDLLLRSRRISLAFISSTTTPAIRCRVACPSFHTCIYTRKPRRQPPTATGLVLLLPPQLFHKARTELLRSHRKGKRRFDCCFVSRSCSIASASCNGRRRRSVSRAVPVPVPCPAADGRLAQGRRQESGAGHRRRRRRAGGEARPRGRRQLRRPRRHRQDPPQLQIQSDHCRFGDAGAGASGAGSPPRREHDHHGLLDARDDRVRAPQARQGVVQAQGDPRGDHVVGERAQPDHPLPRGRSRGLPPQARPTLRRVQALQPDQIVDAAASAGDAY